ncbi:MAG: peptidylprolyl isomerase [Thermoanaerobaculales bacterium]|jgi:peptidyl-prolyl cis-trans isomerase A (cyclophilin A)|nr:peptidylprolyl isomerase [Thermoanaerobaculales bacterium]
MTRPPATARARAAALALLACLAAAGLAAVQAAPEPQPHPALLDPSLAREQAPADFKVRLATTAGDLVIAVHRDWAPHGADRFYNLVKIGYFSNVAFFRVIDGFMAQAGMHGDPRVSQAWLAARIPDDPVRQSNTRGRVTFAMSSEPNSRSVQFFINYGDNSFLDDSGFAPFGEVVEGFETVQALYAAYGEGEPAGSGPSQAKLYRGGNAYLKGQFPKLDYIRSAVIVP